MSSCQCRRHPQRTDEPRRFGRTVSSDALASRRAAAPGSLLCASILLLGTAARVAAAASLEPLWSQQSSAVQTSLISTFDNSCGYMLKNSTPLDTGGRSIGSEPRAAAIPHELDQVFICTVCCARDLEVCRGD